MLLERYGNNMVTSEKYIPYYMHVVDTSFSI